MKFLTDYGDLIIDQVDANEDGWITIQSQSITFDKTRYFIDQFNKDFPNCTLLGNDDSDKFTFLSELCARTPSMRKWFASVSVSYSDTTQLPLYLKNRVAPDEYKSVLNKILILKDELASVVKERNDLARKYTRDLEALNNKERAITEKTIGTDNVMKIVYLTTESLPLSIQLRIQGYMANSSDIDIVDSRRRLAQEYLAKFKIALLDLNKINPKMNVNKIVQEIELK